MNIILWIIQILLALLFLFAGGTKLIMSIEAMRAMGPPNQILLPGLLIRFHWRVRGARRARPNPAWIVSYSPRPDNAGRCRAADHHDRSDGTGHRGRWSGRRSGSLRGGTFFGVRRLWPLAAGPPSRPVDWYHQFYPQITPITQIRNVPEAQ